MRPSVEDRAGEAQQNDLSRSLRGKPYFLTALGFGIGRV
jgi:hypothetical protein